MQGFVLIELKNSAHFFMFIITICFSFFIFLITLWHKSQDVKVRLIGYSFFSTLFFIIISAFINDYEMSYMLLILIEPILLLLIALSLILKPDKSKLKHYSYIIFIIPIVTVMVSYKYPLASNCFLNSSILNYISVAAVGLILYKLIKEKAEERYISLWAVTLLSSILLNSYFSSSKSSLWTVAFLKLGAYAFLLFYFYLMLMKRQFDKIKDTDKILSDINWSIEKEVKKRVIEIENANKRLLDISKIDHLSQVMNKKAIIDSMEMLIYKNSESIFSIMIFDIDDFKNINDTMGHIVGDKCIKHLATIGKGSIREFDLIGRYGGDEFIIVLPDVEISHAYMIAERFRKRVGATGSPHFTISIGLAAYPQDGTNVKSLIKAADKQLYRAKELGKNTTTYRIL